MSKHEALSHFIEGLITGKNVNCATTALRALTGEVKPRERFLEAAFSSTYDIGHLAVAASIELLEKKDIFCRIYVPTNENLVSFLRWGQRHEQEEPAHFLVGGLMSTSLIDLNSGEVGAHVIAITGLHSNGKATIVDTAPIGDNKSTQFIRKVSLKRLARRFVPLEQQPHSLYLIFGEHLNDVDAADPQKMHEVNEAYQVWQAIAEEFVNQDSDQN